MRIYIIGNDGIGLSREAPRTFNEGEIVVASNEELHAAPLVPPVTHTRPVRQDHRGGQCNPTSPSLTSRLNLHRPAAPTVPHSPAISCLGAFPTPASALVAGLINAGVRKPAHER